MNNWKRITLVIFILIGSATFFGYWSFNQFNSAFDNLNDSYLASTNALYFSLKETRENAKLVSEEVATSTDSTGSPQASSGQATTSPEASGLIIGSVDPELSFTFPKSNSLIYIGCTYPISWQSSTAINSLETELIDAGTRQPMGPIAAGLAKENTIEKNSQSLRWKVGSVWPGGYYIKVSKINGVEVEFRSKTFQISKLPAGISEEEKSSICKASAN
jgi:hypothetical protein